MVPHRCHNFRAHPLHPFQEAGALGPSLSSRTHCAVSCRMTQIWPDGRLDATAGIPLGTHRRYSAVPWGIRRHHRRPSLYIHHPYIDPKNRHFSASVRDTFSIDTEFRAQLTRAQLGIHSPCLQKAFSGHSMPRKDRLRTHPERTSDRLDIR